MDPEDSRPNPASSSYDRYSSRPATTPNMNSSRLKRDRAFEERLQSLHMQQRASAVRALERLLKTERLRPMDQLVILFNMHFQRRDTPSFKVVSESALRVLHPNYFEFVPPSEWITKWVAANTDSCAELLMELDEMIMSYRAVLGTGARPSDGEVPAIKQQASSKPLAKGNADGTIGWGPDGGQQEQGSDGKKAISFSTLLAEGAAEDQTIFAATDEEREDADVNTFWALVADCVEATQRYKEIRDCLQIVPRESIVANPASKTAVNTSDPLQLLAGDLLAIGGATSKAPKTNGNQATVPVINVSHLESANVSATQASSAAGGAGGALTSTTLRSTSTSTQVPFYGYTVILQQAAALMNGLSNEELEASNETLAALASAPATIPSLSAPMGENPFFGIQAHFIYKIASADCNRRLAGFYLDAYAKLERKGALEDSGPDTKYVKPPIPQYAIDEAEKIKAKRLALLNQRGSSSADKDEDFLNKGFGIDYIPTEADLMRAMAQDNEAGLCGRDNPDGGNGDDGDEGGGGGGASRGGHKGGATNLASAGGQSFDEGEELFQGEIHDYYLNHLQKQQSTSFPQQGSKAALLTPDGKPRFIKPVRYCKIKSGYVWNAFNRAKFSKRSGEDKPPQIIQWYEFILYYPLAVARVKSPESMFRIEYTDKGPSDSVVILVFSAGPPYADVAYRIVNEKWDRRRGGVKLTFDDKGKLRLFFRLASTNFRR